MKSEKHVKLFDEFINENTNNIDQRNEKNNRLDLLNKKELDWCNYNCITGWFVKDDGKIYVEGGVVEFDEGITITGFPVKFGNCDEFICPEDLRSLEGCPDEVKTLFDCHACNSLKSLEGGPKRVEGSYNCQECLSLKNFVGAPEYVGVDFDADGCKNLKSIEGLPKYIGRFLHIDFCYELVDVELLRDPRYKVKKAITCQDSWKIEKTYGLIFDNDRLFRKWRKSNLSTEEFLKTHR